MSILFRQAAQIWSIRREEELSFVIYWLAKKKFQNEACRDNLETEETKGLKKTFTI